LAVDFQPAFTRFIPLAAQSARQRQRRGGIFFYKENLELLEAGLRQLKTPLQFLHALFVTPLCFLCFFVAIKLELNSE
jgi:hypothetical protein